MNYKSKTCPICGDEFIPVSSKQKYCKKQIKRICPICGNAFIILCQPDNQNPITCNSYECRKHAYGLGTKQKTRICGVCRQPFHPQSSRQLDCNKPIEKVCIVCGKTFTGKCSMNDRATTCSEKCRQKLASENREKSYREDTKICELCRKEFHPKSNTQKICDNIHYRKCVVCGKEFVLDTSKSRADWPETCSHNCAIKYRFRNGNPMSNVSAVYNNRRNKYRGTEDQWDEYNEFLNDPINYLRKLDNPLTLTQLSERFGMSTCQVGQIINQNKAQQYVAYYQSNMENELVEFLKNYIDPKCITRHDRNEIHPYELDIWIPSKRLAIECNPTSTHNSTRPMIEGGYPTPIKYHMMKTDLCLKNNIDLIHLFGYDWIHKQEIMKSIILSRLSIYQNIVFARKCELRDVNHSEAKRFLEDNHRQGNANCSVRIGLYYQNELVSLMTFSKNRSTIGNFNDSETYELVRFCNKLNTKVTGGASKLFNHFIKTHRCNKVVSYSDRARMRGHIYQTLGFNKMESSDPGYVWVDYKTEVAYNRVNTQKHNIIKFLKDDSIDLSKSEKEIMSEHGYVQVFDSGTTRWEWFRNE